MSEILRNSLPESFFYKSVKRSQKGKHLPWSLHKQSCCPTTCIFNKTNYTTGTFLWASRNYSEQLSSQIKRFLEVFRSSHERCSIKKLFLKISQSWQESACVGVSFQPSGLQLYRDSNTDVFL